MQAMNITEYENFIERLFKGIYIPNLPFVVGLQEYTKDFTTAYMFLEDLKEYYKNHYIEIKERFKNNPDINLPDISQNNKVNLIAIIMDLDNQLYVVGTRLNEAIFNIPMLGETKSGINEREKQLLALLETKEAFAIFRKAYDYGLIDKNKKWLKSTRLLSIFAKEMSITLGLNKAIKPDNNHKALWEPFEIIFDKKKGSLRGHYSNARKTVNEVEGIDIIEKIFPGFKW